MQERAQNTFMKSSLQVGMAKNGKTPFYCILVLFHNSCVEMEVKKCFYGNCVEKHCGKLMKKASRYHIAFARSKNIGKISWDYSKMATDAGTG